MKKLFWIVPFIAILFILSFAYAASKAPDKVVFKPKKGTVTFPHKKHYTEIEKNCLHCHHKSKTKETTKKCSSTNCHSTDKKAEKSLYKVFHAKKLKDAKEKARTCLGCHKAKKTDKIKPPTKCKQCHIKKK